MRNKFAFVSDPNDFVTDPGSSEHVLYTSRIVNGVIKLVKSGVENIQDKIQSFKDQTDMSFILSRLAMGDTSVFRSDPPMYGDFSHVPQSYADALQLVMDAEKKFNMLPLDVRNEFDNDYRQWFASAGSDSWLSKMDSVIEKPDAGLNPVIPDPKEGVVTE